VPLIWRCSPSMTSSLGSGTCITHPWSLRSRRPDEGGSGDLRFHALQKSLHRYCGSGEHNDGRVENTRPSTAYPSSLRTRCQTTDMRRGLRVAVAHNFGRGGCA
jgi:hypothetical protein